MMGIEVGSFMTILVLQSQYIHQNNKLSLPAKAKFWLGLVIGILNCRGPAVFSKEESLWVQISS